MTFQQKLDTLIQKNNSLVCVGLDSAAEKLPHHLDGVENAVFVFNKAIIDQTHDLVCSYKPNSAFYESQGEHGVLQLKMTCDYIRQTYPEIPIILDAKRADIGNTNEGYIKYIYDYLQVDAVTVQPYLGGEALKPFLDIKDKGTIVLCRTSNPGAGEFQDLILETSHSSFVENTESNKEPLYIIVARKVTGMWNTYNNCLLVVGATYPEELKEIRKIAGEMTFLVPGIGTQGGDIAKTMQYGLNASKKGLIISSSRAIIFASNGEDFAEKARVQTQSLRDELNSYRIT